MIADTRNTWGWPINSRSSRRFLVIGYWIFVLALTCAFLRFGIVHGVFANPWMLYVLVFLPSLLGGVRAGGAVKPFRGLRWAPLNDRDGTQTVFGKPQPVIRGAVASEFELDERETHERDRVHFIAYTVARWGALALLALTVIASTWRPGWLVWMAPTFFFVLVLTLWSLPQSIILWTEPDVEEPR
jgi:hypothetical protein